MSEKICQFKAAEIDEGSLVDHTIYYTPARNAYKAAYRHWRSSSFAMIPCNGLAAVVKEDAYRSWKHREDFVIGWSSVKRRSDFHKRKFRVVTDSWRLFDSGKETK